MEHPFETMPFLGAPSVWDEYNFEAVKSLKKQGHNKALMKFLNDRKEGKIRDLKLKAKFNAGPSSVSSCTIVKPTVLP